MNTPKQGDRQPVIDAKGRRRGMKEWVLCPLCDEGRWVREDALKLSCFTGLCSKCHNKITTGRRELHGRWKGGKRSDDKGYQLLRIDKKDPLYCMAKRSGYAYAHRIEMAKAIGRPLYSWEIVHHKDGNKENNSVDNLVLLEDKADHQTSIAVAKEIRKLEVKIQILEAENLELRKAIKQ